MARQEFRAQAAAPYATGGGGVVLEHRYGATLLASLLTGDPLPELGDDVVPVAVRFQAAAVSAVDDLLVTGETQDGGQRRVSIGVRRAPALTSGDAASAGLVGSYLAVVADHGEEVAAGRWRLALAVASPNPAVRQARELAAIAWAVTSEGQFRAEVARPGRTSQAVRKRLDHLDALATAGLRDVRIDADAADARELTWRMLAALKVRELRLEGADESDRSTVVAQLRRVTEEGSVPAADRLLTRLVELAGHYAPAGAEVTGHTLRRDLSGIPLAVPSAPHPVTIPVDTSPGTANVSSSDANGQLRAEFMGRLHEESGDTPWTWIAPAPIGLRIGIESGWELQPLVEFLERAGYLETNYEEQVRLTDAGRREVTKNHSGMRTPGARIRQPEGLATEGGQLQMEFMGRLYEEEPNESLTWIDPKPIGLRIGIESGWELQPLVELLERAGYLETNYEEQVRLTDAGRREVMKRNKAGK